jgi:hypothetical protein
MQRSSARSFHDNIQASERQFQCVFLEPIIFPNRLSGGMSTHRRANSLMEAVCTWNPSFARLVVDLFNLNPEDGTGWLAEELLYAPLKPEHQLAEFDRYEPDLIALGVSALKKVVDMYDVTIWL